ncbi:hypothetical protein [Candidatus Poriferisodalis sp.]|uniref:hypothetical protein n=1 Tax=Candidatus Poriferisodalis sp. TaxID=3101277 RepID=UPI003B020276
MHGHWHHGCSALLEGASTQVVGLAANGEPGSLAVLGMATLSARAPQGAAAPA